MSTIFKKLVITDDAGEKIKVHKVLEGNDRVYITNTGAWSGAAVTVELTFAQLAYLAAHLTEVVEWSSWKQKVTDADDCTFRTKESDTYCGACDGPCWYTVDAEAYDQFDPEDD